MYRAYLPIFMKPYGIGWGDVFSSFPILKGIPELWIVHLQYPEFCPPLFRLFQPFYYSVWICEPSNLYCNWIYPKLVAIFCAYSIMPKSIEGTNTYYWHLKQILLNENFSETFYLGHPVERRIFLYKFLHNLAKILYFFSPLK